MTTQNERITKLEGQINAIAQAWLYLAAAVEMQAGIDIERMEGDLCMKRWPGNPDIDGEARIALHWLCQQLDNARDVRRARQEGESAWH